MPKDDVIVNLVVNTDKAKRNVGSLSDKFGGMAKGVLGAAGIVMAFRQVTRVMGEMVDAYGIQEQAEQALTAAIRITGKEATISTDALFSLASELQQVTVYGDEATISAMAMLQQLGDLSEQGLKKVTPLVQDFAAAMGVDLKTAASLVGKTLGSTTNALSRYGIEIDATAPKEEKLIELTAALEDKFGGMARAMGGTTLGAIKQLSNAFGDLQEIGGELAAEGLKPIAQWLTVVFSNAVKAHKQIQLVNEALAGDAELTGLEKMRGAYEALNSQWMAAINNTKALTGQLQMTEGQTDSLIDLIEKKMEVLRREIDLAEFIEKINEANAAKAIKNIDRIAESYRGLMGEFAFGGGFDPFAGITDADFPKPEPDMWRGVADMTKQSADALADMKLSMDDIWETAPPILKVAEEMSEQFKELAANAEAFGDTLESVITTGITGMLQGLGAIAVAGEEAFDILKAAAKNALATMLEALGNYAIAQGLVFMAADPVKGILLLAAGAAAHVAAGVVKTLGAGGIIDEPVVGIGQHTGQRYLLGESGPEIVMPVNGAGVRGGGGRGGVIIINNETYNIQGSLVTREQVATDVTAIQMRKFRGY